MRGGVGRAGESMNRPREDLPTLRVTNVSEDANEDDLRELFSRFGRVHRVYIGRDRETGHGKGYAFVSFEDRAVAERAMHRIHGMGAYLQPSLYCTPTHQPVFFRLRQPDPQLPMVP